MNGGHERKQTTECANEAESKKNEDKKKKKKKKKGHRTKTNGVGATVRVK